jgi:hypothetical protein
MSYISAPTFVHLSLHGPTKTLLCYVASMKTEISYNKMPTHIPKNTSTSPIKFSTISH